MVKKQIIMEKALDLFAQQGFEATSVQQITEHCGISKGAFYLSFKSKDELILALIDHFMMKFISDIDYMVKYTNDECLLYEFYYNIYSSFHEHSNFAKIFMKEQAQTLNKELFTKVHYYDRLLDNIVLSMIDRLYGDEIIDVQYDLTYCIKGFTRMYSELFLFDHVQVDLNSLALSLVEKTNLLAKQTTIPFISKELAQVFSYSVNEEVTSEQLIMMIEQKLLELEESLEKESLILLKQQLLDPTLSLAIVKGLIENIRHHPHCKWLSYLLRHHFHL